MFALYTARNCFNLLYPESAANDSRITSCVKPAIPIMKIWTFVRLNLNSPENNLPSKSVQLLRSVGSIQSDNRPKKEK